MVPLGAVEDLAATIWPAAAHAVVAVTDPRKGEQLVLVTTEKQLTRQMFAGAAREAGMPELWVPRTISVVREIPVLGTGKTDYLGVARLAAEATAT